MTILDKLLETGLKCPCGFQLEVYTNKYWPEDGTTLYEDHMVYCDGCGSHGSDYLTIIEAVTAWLVLTGGPIPGEIHPPRTHDIIVNRANGLNEIQWWADGYRCDDYEGLASAAQTPKQWYFARRDPETIRAWLEEEA